MALRTLENVILAAEVLGATVVVSDDITVRWDEAPDGSPLFVLEPRVPNCAQKRAAGNCTELEILKTNQVVTNE